MGLHFLQKYSFRGLKIQKANTKYIILISIRPGAKYIEKYSNTLQLLSLINDYNYITITGPVEM